MESSYLTAVLRPVWGDEEHTYINCFIKNTTYGDEELPFTASAVDPEVHGRKIFNDLVSGVYGDIEEYVAPPPPPQQKQPTVTGTDTL